MGFAVNIAVTTPPWRHASSTVDRAVGQARVGVVEAVHARREAGEHRRDDGVRERARGAVARRTSSPRPRARESSGAGVRAAPRARATSPTCCRARRARRCARRRGRPPAAEPAATTRAPPRSTRVPSGRRASPRAPARRARRRRRGPSRAATTAPTRPPSPATCAVPRTIGGRRSRTRRASTSASPPPAVASEASSVAFGGDPAGAAHEAGGAQRDAAHRAAADRGVDGDVVARGGGVRLGRARPCRRGPSRSRRAARRSRAGRRRSGASARARRARASAGADARARTMRVSPFPSATPPTGLPSMATATPRAMTPRTRASTYALPSGIVARRPRASRSSR